MDAKSRKVLNHLKKAGVEQDAFDLSIAVGVDEDAVQGLLGVLAGEGLVSSRRGEGGKVFWSVAGASGAASDAAAEPKGAGAGRKRGRATAGPDDRFEELIADPAAGPVGAPPPIPAPAPPPIPAEPAVEDFEFAPQAAAGPAAGGFGAAAGPKPQKEGPARARKDDGRGGDDSFEAGAGKRPKRQQSAGADDHFDEFAEKVVAKPKLPIQLMAWAAILVLILVLFIMSSSSGGRAKKVQTEMEKVIAELNKLDSLRTKTDGEIDKLKRENKALAAEIKSMKADMKKPAPTQEAPPPANVKNAAKPGAKGGKVKR